VESPQAATLKATSANREMQDKFGAMPGRRNLFQCPIAIAIRRRSGRGFWNRDETRKAATPAYIRNGQPTQAHEKSERSDGNLACLGTAEREKRKEVNNNSDNNNTHQEGIAVCRK
jgi:hypothetical protein